MKSPGWTSTTIARTSAAAGVAAGLVALSVAQPGLASAAPKASGTIKIHAVGSSEDDNGNEPKVCAFTLIGDDFDADEQLSYNFVLGAPFQGAPVLVGSVTTDAHGSFSTTVINLESGHYKATVLDGETNKEKVFKVDCDPVVPDPEVPDPEVPDPEVPDPEVPDPEVPDPEVPDPEVPDPEVPDPEVPDPEVPDPEVPDPEVPDPEVPDPEVPDPEVPDPGTTNPSGEADADPAPDVDTAVVLPSEPDVVDDDTVTAPELEAAPEADPESAPEIVAEVIDEEVGAGGLGDPVTGTAVSHDVAVGVLPQTGTNTAGIGVAGLLLVAAGLGLRRAVRPADVS